MNDRAEWRVHLEREIRKRVEEMEGAGYIFPPAFSGIDWALAIITIAASGALLIAGAWM